MLPAPNLDDRTFQDLVDDAKRLVQTALPRVDRPQRLRPRRDADRGVRPDGRPADLPAEPGARPALRQVPGADRRRAAAAGRRPRPGDVLAVGPAAAAGAGPHRDPGGDTRAPTSTTRSCSARRASSRSCPARSRAPAPPGRRRPGRHDRGAVGCPGLRCFSQTPAPGDALLIGLSDAVPSCAVILRMELPGLRRRRRPPAPAAGLGGLDRHRLGRVRGRIRRHRWPQQARRRGAARARRPPGVDHRPAAGRLAALPAGRAARRPADVHRIAARSLRSRPSPSAAPCRSCTRRCCTARCSARSDGTPAQRFALQRRPVLAVAPAAARSRCGRPRATRSWTEVGHFAESTPEDRHFRIDHVAGEVQFGPAVRLADGSLRHYGAVPPRRRLVAADGVPDRWRAAGQRHRGTGPGPEDQRAVRRAGGEPRRRPSAEPTRRRWRTPRCAARCCSAHAGGR